MKKISIVTVHLAIDETEEGQVADALYGILTTSIREYALVGESVLLDWKLLDENILSAMRVVEVDDDFGADDLAGMEVK